MNVSFTISARQGTFRKLSEACFIPNPAGKFIVANLLLLSLRTKRGNLFSPQHKLREAIPHLSVEIATHLSGDRNDTCINHLNEFAGFALISSAHNI